MARKHWFGLACCVAGILGLLGLSPDAGAFPAKESPADCDLTNFSYWIDNPGVQGLMAGAVGAVQAGFEEFNLLNDMSGTQLLDVNDVGSGTFVHVQFVTDINGDPDKRGIAEIGACTDPLKKILINYAAISHLDLFKDVARHEMGHILGMGHTGDGDAFVGLPAMATCTGVSIGRSMTKDDRASARFHADNTTAQPVGVNIGYETGTLGDWVPVSGSFLTGYAPFQGLFEVVLPANGGRIYQEVNFNSSPGDGNDLEVAGMYRTEGPPSNNAVLTFAYQRDASYPVGTPECAYGFPNIRFDLPRDSAMGPFTYRGHAWAPTSSSYQSLPFPEFTPFSPPLGELDTEDFKVSVGYWRQTGHAEVDNIQLRVDYQTSGN